MTDVFLDRAGLAGVAVTDDYASYVEDIDEGNILGASGAGKTVSARDVLEARIRAGNNSSTNVFFGEAPRRVRLNEEGKLTDGNSELVRESRRVDEAQSELLLEVFDERQRAQSSLQAANDSLRRIAGATSYYQDIVQDSILGASGAGQTVSARDVLEARIRAGNNGTNVFFGEGATRVRLNEEGKLTDGNSKIVRESRRVDEAQSELLLEVFDERQRAQSSLQAANDSLRRIAGATSYYKDIVQDSILGTSGAGQTVSARDVLEARIRAGNNGTNVFFGEGATRVRLNEEGKLTDGNSKIVRESRRVDDAQRELLLEAFDRRAELLAELEGEVREAFLERGIDAARKVLAGFPTQTMPEVETIETQGEILNGLETILRDGEVLTHFTALLEESAREALAYLTGVESTIPEERALVVSLFPFAQEAAIAEVSARVLDPNFDPAVAAEELRNAIRDFNLSEEQFAPLAAYVSRRLLADEYFGLFENVEVNTLDCAATAESLETLPIRQSTAEFDYFGERQSLVEAGLSVLEEVREAQLRALFADAALSAEKLAEMIGELPVVDRRDQALRDILLDDLTLYVAARRRDSPRRLCILVFRRGGCGTQPP